jgi:hypothetical protein
LCIHAFIPSAGVILGFVLIQIIDTKMFVKTAYVFKGKNKIKRGRTAQIGTKVRARVINAVLMARFQFASERS